MSKVVRVKPPAKPKRQAGSSSASAPMNEAAGGGVQRSRVAVRIHLAPGTEALAPQREAVWIETRHSHRLRTSTRPVGGIGGVVGALREARQARAHRLAQAGEDRLTHQAAILIGYAHGGGMRLAGERVEGLARCADAGAEHRTVKGIARAQSLDRIGGAILVDALGHRMKADGPGLIRIRWV